jgi:hypothetical protein
MRIHPGCSELQQLDCLKKTARHGRYDPRRPSEANNGVTMRCAVECGDCVFRPRALLAVYTQGKATDLVRWALAL